MLVASARVDNRWRHQPYSLQPSRDEHRVDSRPLVGHVQLHVQSLHLLLDERKVQERIYPRYTLCHVRTYKAP